MNNSDTIYALSSGSGLAGVAVIRVSGARAGSLVKELCSSLPVPRAATLSAIRQPADGRLIDRGLVLWFPGPASFTGEDVAEFHVHGGVAVVQALFDTLAGFEGVRIAEAGEFTRRAFGNGKFDLIEVEGLADLIEARTEAQRRQALHHSEGAVSRVFDQWRQDIARILARLEAAIDFVDEAHVEEEALRTHEAALEGLVRTVETEIERGRAGERLRDGFRVVLAGAPNVGKSSLLNQLGGKDAAIVSPIPGTTRDLVEVHLNLAGIPVILQDTAGLRAASEDPIEQAGMARAGKALGGADVILWLSSADAAGPARPPQFDSDVIWIWNKCDLALPRMAAPNGRPYMAISCVTGEGLPDLEAEIIGYLERLAAKGETALVVRRRHREALLSMTHHLRSALAKPAPALEIVTEYLRLAAADIGRLTGHIDVESLLDMIFRDFCIGK
ncbi:MAG: tRNA uridine-5-carboxymethylaminomethyl(34) synthesis GTPase MnmE [Aestuariivirgaceae bacterium]